MSKKIMCLSILSLLLGCSSTSSNNNTAMLANNNDAAVQAKDDDKAICFQEKTLGSNRKSIRCTTKKEQAKSREVSREAWLRQQQGSVKAGG